MKSTISEFVKNNLCTGGDTCIALCPNEALKMVINSKKSIFTPQLNEEICNKCGLCYVVCPGYKVDLITLNLEIFGKEPEDIIIGNYMNIYIGHAADYDIQYNSASGGLITAILVFRLEEGLIDGALVTRMNKKSPLEPEPFIARTREEIISARGSKYCPVPVNIAMREILEAEDGEQVWSCGTAMSYSRITQGTGVECKAKRKGSTVFGNFMCAY